MLVPGSFVLWGINGIMSTCKKKGSDGDVLTASPMLKLVKRIEKKEKKVL